MTKHFCDMCGKPAAESYPEFFQEGIGDLYGKKVGVRAVFEVVYDTSNCTRRDPVDLCSGCQEHLLERLSIAINTRAMR
jgi:hypothetical protein